MTDPHRQLDPSIFHAKGPLTLYRLARARYANLSGIGAANQPGRWNAPGQEAIYTSTEIGVPVLERLVHTPKDMIPSNLAMLTIQVSGDWVSFREGELTDPNTNSWFQIHTSIDQARLERSRQPSGDGWPAPPFAMAVPSVIIPAWNVILYPQEIGFWQHVKLVNIEPFAFDLRLFPESTPIER